MPVRDLFPSDWLVTTEYSEKQLGLLKTGKESEVHLVARAAGGRLSLLARKCFKDRSRRAFRNDWTYRGIWGEGTRREHRAMKNNTRFGHLAVHGAWIDNEWRSLVHLHDAGATVPPPVERVDDGYVMAFIGDGTRAAPRLAEVDLDPTRARRVWNDLLAELALLVSADRVHGDLSAYNLLWWRERAVLIDFSQTVNILEHPAARELLVRDITRLGAYFARRGIAVDAERVLAEIGADDHRFALQLLRPPPSATR